MKKTTTNGVNGLNGGDKYTLCPEFMKLVHLVMDGEATTEEEKLFVAHIEESKDCKDHYLEEKNIRALLKTKCGKTRVPDQLVHAIQMKLQEIMTA